MTEALEFVKETNDRGGKVLLQRQSYQFKVSNVFFMADKQSTPPLAL